jgi:hypothetical protein
MRNTDTSSPGFSIDYMLFNPLGAYGDRLGVRAPLSAAGSYSTTSITDTILIQCFRVHHGPGVANLTDEPRLRPTLDVADRRLVPEAVVA